MTYKYSLILMAALAAHSVQAQDTGAYLSGRVAAQAHDFDATKAYLGRVLASDPSRIDLQALLLNAHITQGNLDAAYDISAQMQTAGLNNQPAALAQITKHFLDQNWSAAIAQTEEDTAVVPLVQHTTRAWALMGEGQFNAGLEALGAAAQDDLIKLHIAMMHAQAGNIDQAIILLEAAATNPQNSGINATIARAQLLSQNGRFTDALELIDLRFGTANQISYISDLRAGLEANEPQELTVLNTPEHMLAQVFSVAFVGMIDQNAFGPALAYGRFASALNPDDHQLPLLLARTLGALNQHGAAIAEIDKVMNVPDFRMEAQLSKANLHIEADEFAAAEILLRDLSTQIPDNPTVWGVLAENMQHQSKLEAAIAAYDKAIALSQDRPNTLVGFYYGRAIAHSSLDRVDNAEADLRAALAIAPNHPSILNYLGYSLIERGGDYDEALDMIERAIASDPENGAIVDSLAWAYFRLGRYEDAVAPMERAIQLMPVDPILSDHMGDILWAVGRKHEARFQWQRALSFNPKESDQTRILRKLEIGLDALLEEEGAPGL